MALLIHLAIVKTDFSFVNFFAALKQGLQGGVENRRSPGGYNPKPELALRGMVMTTLKKPHFSAQDDLVREVEKTEQHEYLAGEGFAMAVAA